MQKIFKNPYINALLFVLLCAVARVLYIQYGPLDLAADEAQYWDWSRHLQGGYATKPPLIAWLIAGSTWLWGASTELSVRLPAVVLHGGLSFLVFHLLTVWRNERYGWLGLITFQVTPILLAGGLLMTTDIPLAFLWLAALVLLSQIDWQSGKAYWLQWIGIGVLIGLAGLTKLTAGVFYPLLGVYLMFDTSRRGWLLKPQVYVAGIVSLLVLMPYWIWNINNGFESILHVVWQAEGGGDGAFEPWHNWGELLLSQLGIYGLFTFVGVVMYWFAQRANMRGGSAQGELLWWFSAPLFALFMLKAITAKIQANWPLLAVMVGVIGLIGWLAGDQKWRRYATRIYIVGLGLNILLCTLLLWPALQQMVGIKKNPLRELMLGEALAQQVAPALAQTSADTPIVTTRYQTTALLAFYLPHQPRVGYINTGGRRMNQYELWGEPNIAVGEQVIYVNERGKLDSIIEQRFGPCTPAGEVAFVCVARSGKALPPR